MKTNSFIAVENNTVVRLAQIPVIDYATFTENVDELLADKARHCVSYYGYNQGGYLRLICCIADDAIAKIYLFSHYINIAKDKTLPSLTPKHFSFHNFEREIHENFGIDFIAHPWLKGVRFPFDASDKSKTMDNYPFYEIESDELHEVGVGPVHAGVIEPGHFRFICNGEKVIHLEIQLGYQHRGVEELFKTKTNLQRHILSENIAGDTAIGHSLAYVSLMETLSGIKVSEVLQIERCIALELERIAVHIGDTAALCTDIAYQLGQVVNEALRTSIINTTQKWCGNRFGKGGIRTDGTNYPMNDEFIYYMMDILEDTLKRYLEMSDRMLNLSSVNARFDDVGTVTTKQAELIGAVGMAARTCNIKRDIRSTHPFQYYKNFKYDAVTLESGDVLARATLRRMEVERSVAVIRQLVNERKKFSENYYSKKPNYNIRLAGDSFAISLTEGWRGEICHTAITGRSGELLHYKIKDPSFHNWMALAIAVRNQEISDFPVCNKSFNLSYCGNDL